MLMQPGCLGKGIYCVTITIGIRSVLEVKAAPSLASEHTWIRHRALFTLHSHILSQPLKVMSTKSAPTGGLV